MTSHVTDLSARKVLVTGAASGLGAAICCSLAGVAARVAMLDLNDEPFDEMRAQLGPDVHGFRCDVTDAESLEAAIQSAADVLDGLDAIVAVAGRGIVGTIPTGDPRVWRELLALNLVGPLATVRYGVQHFGSTGRRDVVFIGSAAALTPAAGLGIYAATKRGVHAAAEALRLELAPRGINVSIVVPGVFQTKGATGASTIDGDVPLDAVPKFVSEDVTPPLPSPLADTVAFMLGLPEHICLNEVVIRPTAELTP